MHIQSQVISSMLAVLRQAIPELTRGVTTSLALLSAPSCLACNCAPALTCPENFRCPDCHCSGQTRICHVGELLGFAWRNLGEAGLVGFLVGICAAVGLTALSLGCGRPARLGEWTSRVGEPRDRHTHFIVTLTDDSFTPFM